VTAYVRPMRIAEAPTTIPTRLQERYKGSQTWFSGTVTAGGNTADMDLGVYGAAEVQLRVTAVSGTSPSLSVYIEGKFEPTDSYKSIASQTNITAAGTWFFTINPLVFRFVRVRWTVAGTTPSFTFTVAAQLMT
jgi:hypothetical protein